jgi:threonine dehydratase
MSDEVCITLSNVQDAAARIKDDIHETPVLSHDNLSSIAGCHVHFKMELLQRCKAFKFRGALNKVRTLPPGETVATCSAGNHSQGVALAARLCGSRSVIFMSEIAPASTVEATRHYGGEVIQIGSSFDETKDACLEAVNAHSDWHFVHPFNDRLVIAGTSTIGLEIIDQCPTVDTIVVSIGAGGLASGVSFAAKSLKPSVRIIGVQLASCPHAYRRFDEVRGDSIPQITAKEAVMPLGEMELR